MAQPNDLRSSETDSKSTAEAMANSAGLDAEKDSAADLAAAGYGTRSRHRSGTSRPNYAEDKDIEMDVYDYYDKKDADGAKKSSRFNATSNDSAPRGSAATRKAATADDSKAAPSQNGARDHISNGTTNAQASQISAAQPSRKRKAAVAAAQMTSVAASNKRAGTSTPQSSVTTWPETNMLSFENCKARPQNGRMVADDGTVLEANDHVYLVCEPPGEPYYLGRIMEFLHNQNDASRPVDSVRINWYYRPKDIGRKSPDTRLVFATMHSDISPLAALRGKCQIRHRAEIDSLDEYRKTPDSFWFEKLYDRYIQKNYDLIPTKLIVNVPDRVKKVLDERWKYVLVEQGRGKELTSAVKLCKRCSGYCASNDSVDCAVCHFTYHMNCVRPPLLKKPSRGFAWSCAACSRAQERKLEARDTPNGTDGADGDDDDLLDDDDDELQDLTNRTSPADDDEAHQQGTAEQVYHASLWPYRYLGIHCKPEDALDYDDRIYPRAGTRIGPRHQASVHPWPGRPVEYVKPLESRRGKKGVGLSKEVQAAQEAEKAQRGKRPKWVQDQPPGYTARGEDHEADDPNCTATPLWIPPADEKKPPPDEVEEYMNNARDMARSLDLPKQCTNLQDVAISQLYRQDYNAAEALDALAKTPMADFKEPRPTAAENKKFDEAMTKYGNELGVVARHVKSMTPGQVVRYYYTWKKTDRGKQIWGNHTGRKGKKQGKRAEAAASKLADDVADPDDDSAFDTVKASEKKRSFICQFCNTTSSRQWRRAPNSAQGLIDEDGVPKPANKDKNTQVVVALCRRCAELWRRYGIRWEDIDEVAKKVAQSGKAWKRKQDEELLKELQAAQDLGLMTPDREATPMSGVGVSNGIEPPRKKLKGALDKEVDADVATKKKDKTAESTPIPEMPKPRTLPCAICNEMEPLGDAHVSCRECRLTVHRNCYGILGNRMQGKWLCDMCTNDKNPRVSVHYKCVLCPVDHTEHEFVDQPKLTHHKKKMSDKDRERERIEVQQARKAAEFYKKRQEELNRPVNPREPLKRTADNNWVHVTCAVWTPEVKFGNARAMEPCEGIPSIPRAKYDEVCHACNNTGGACVPCHQCRIPFHIECARQQGHLLGFDIAPVKSSRRDQFNIVSINGESGTMSAMLWCKDHVPTKSIAHKMHDVVGETGLNALQLFVQNYKQADLTLTGTVRRANLVTNSAKTASAATQAAARRASTAALNGVAVTNGDQEKASSDAREPGDKVCISCGIDVTPRWWPIDMSQERQLTNGHHGAIGLEAQKFVEQRRFQCHKCHKLARTPRPHSNMPPAFGPEPGHVTPQHQSLPPATMPSLRSPPPPPAPVIDYRGTRQNSHPWPRPPSSHHPGPGMSLGGPPPPPHPVQTPSQSQVSRPPPPLSHGHPGPHVRGPSPYGDWGHHESPPRHLNGGPPPLHSEPAPVSSLPPPSRYRPPYMPHVGVTPGPRRSPPPPPVMYGLPPSPRRHGGPTPPSPYMAPYHGVGPHGGHQPAHGSPYNLPNGGVPPPPPPPPPSRSDAFAHGLHPQRSGYPTHESPPMARNGLPPPRDPPPPARGADGRPPSGASASPSLRNLLS